MSLPRKVAQKIIKGETRNAPAKKEKTLSGRGVSAAKNWAAKAFSAKSDFVFSAIDSPCKNTSIDPPYDL